MKKILITFVVALFGFAAANAAAIKTWTTEALRYADLNANFQHIHDNMVGNHGARLVNADVSASAAIAHSKMANPEKIAKAWAFFTTAGAVCSGATCTLSASSGVTSVTRSGAGAYTLTYSSTRNANQFAIAAPMETTLDCRVTAFSTTTATINCFTFAGVATDARVMFIEFDATN